MVSLNRLAPPARNVTRIGLELADLHRTEAELTFTVEDPPAGEAYVHGFNAVREGFDDPSCTLEWNEDQGLWEAMPEEDS